MLYEEKQIETIPVGPLGLIPLKSCEDLGKKVDAWLVEWRKERESEHKTTIAFAGYQKDSYIIGAKTPRFGSGEAKGELTESVRGDDLYIMVDVCNYNMTYTMNGLKNHMSPDDHYQDLKRVIAAVGGKGRRINVIMPFLYESRQHKRTGRESLDCAMALRELVDMGVENIIAIDGDEKRLQMAKRFGAKYTMNFKNYKDLDEQVRRLKELTSGRGADFAFQCTGVPAAASNVWKFVKRGGGLAEIGFFVDNGCCSINPHHDICKKEITMVGSWTYKVSDYPITFDFLRRAVGIGLPIEELITHEYSLDQMNEAMDTNMKQLGIKIAYINKN